MQFVHPARSLTGGLGRDLVLTMCKTNLPEYGIWNGMLNRCYNPNDRKYPIYGGRGITVCDEWFASFEAFYRDVGPRPSKEYSLDRIRSNEGYNTSNVRWATIHEQNNNKRTNRRITAFGQTKTLAEWAMFTGINRRTIAKRLDAGRTPEEALANKVALNKVTNI